MPQPARVLVIEDNPVNLELMTYLIRAWGHEVLTATSGEAGLALARAQPPQLILCDIQMPGIDGYEVARRLRADPQLSTVPRVALTALAMRGDDEKSLLAGFDAHCSKPIDVQPFMDLVNRLLGHAQAPPAPAGPAGQALPADEMPQHLRAPRAPCALLVVDDGPINLDFKRSLFEPAGYAVHSAAGLEEAIALADAQAVDLILSDVVLAKGDGFDLLRHVQAHPRLSRLPFVFLTSSRIDDVSRDLALARGARRYLIRPIEPQRLLAELREVLVQG